MILRNQVETLPSPELKARFGVLSAQWKRDARFLSSVPEMAMLPVYQEIIGMGPAAIPLLLDELRREPDHWFWALRAITGTNPIPDEYRGDLAAMSQAWLQWGRDHGYLK